MCAMVSARCACAVAYHQQSSVNYGRAAIHQWHPVPRQRRAVLCRAATSQMSTSKGASVLVVAGPSTPELSVLEKLPSGVRIVGVGQSLEALSSLTDQDWASIDVVLNCGVGANAGKREHIQSFWPKLTGLKWLHSASAGLEHLLWPDLVKSPVQLTNAKGVYSHSLAEYTLAACNWFAKDFPRLIAAKAEHKWDPYDVEELRGKTLGVVGYGDIGQAAARIARAFKMRVVAMRRRATLSEQETKDGILSALYTPEQLPELMAASDYVVAALPHTPSTHELVNAAAIAAMKPNGVFINVGRGKTVEEPALIEALQKGRIRGAALDVFYTEPLPTDSPLWDLPNVLMSPHCADRTKEFQHESIELFVENMQRYVKGEPLQNVCDKEKGY